MKQKFKLTTSTKMQSLKGFFYSLIMLFGSVAFFYYLFGKSTFIPLYLLLAIFFIFYTLPVILLYNNYLKYAENIVVVLQENTMTINDKTYTSDEIDQIEIYATIQHVKKSSGAYTFSHNEYYYYIAIDLKEGETIVLNSLLGQDLDEALKKAFPDTKIKYTYSFFSRLMITENSFSKERV